MCSATKLDNDDRKKKKNEKNESENSNQVRRRRGKRVKQESLDPSLYSSSSPTERTVRVSKVKSSLRKKYEGESKSGGIEALLPSLGIITVLAFAGIARMGWRGRASVAGIDLGTTNSVICVQQQSKEGVGEIECIPDPYNNSPIVPSVVSLLDPHHVQVTKIKRQNSVAFDSINLHPHPAYAIVGSEAKDRIDSHPHHTLYHAKRVLGMTFEDAAVQEMGQEVEFDIVQNGTSNIAFRVPFHSREKTSSYSSSTLDSSDSESVAMAPHQVGSYVVNHLIQMTQKYLGHDNIKSAVIAVPAKFEHEQILQTVQAFKNAGVSVARILEEPVAAAIAYGLQKKKNVDYILVYDFGGGTLDVSVLQVFEGGYVEVIGNDGDVRLGGADFDAAVAHLLLEHDDGYGSNVVKRVMEVMKDLERIIEKDTENMDVDEKDAEEVLWGTCPTLKEMPLCTLSSFHTMGEKMKIGMSSKANGSDIVHSTCLGFDDGTNVQTINKLSQICDMLKPVELSLSLDQYNGACEPLFKRSILPVHRLLEDLDLKPDEIDEVVMVGGTTRMPQIRELVRKQLEVESLNTSIDPDLTVAYGAASVID